MTYQLPIPVKTPLATREARLHHYLWHGIRNGWAFFTEAQKAALRAIAPGWVPNHARFNADESLNYGGGESFLYMHRRMIQSVNAQLTALGEPVLVPWADIPEADDTGYPVPGGNNSANTRDPKSVAGLARIKTLAQNILRPERLRTLSLSEFGTLIESYVHDPLHMRWAGDEGVMADFPNPDPLVLNPTLDAKYDALDSDYLGHPYSSHVNSTFWMLHGWVDRCIDQWQTANGLSQIPWTDTWEGSPHSPPVPDVTPVLAGLFSASVLAPHSSAASVASAIPPPPPGDHHDHGHSHGNLESLTKTFKLVNTFKECRIGFDYASRQPLPDRFKTLAE
ncbi:MAG TPA: hypothetical protein VGE29_06405 [Prosthecobacter sp.]